MLRRLSLLLVFLLTLVAPVYAQTLNATSLSAAATATGTSLTVVSGSGISAGHLAFIDHETLTITAVSGATVTVQRGRAGLAGAHGAGAAVYTGPPESFFVTPPPSDACLTGQSADPYINISTAKVFVCANGYWQSLNDLPPMGAAGTVLVSNGAGKAPSPALGAAMTTLTATDTALAVKTQLADVNGATYTPTLAGGGAGNLSNGVYSYKFTVDDYGGGHTAVGSATPAVTVVDATMDGQVTLPIPNTTAYWQVLNIYRTAAGGSTYKLVEAITYTAADTTYTDNIADASLGATAPTTNTTLNTRLSFSGSTVTVPALAVFSGAITTTTVNKVTLTAPASSATLTIANGKTLTASNTLRFAGTDSTVMTFPSTSATVARTDAANAFTGAQTATVSVAAPKLLGSGTTPAVTNTSSNSCGTSAATIVGKDLAGKVTVGATSGTSCTVTFATAWSNAPACTVMNETTANLARATSTTTTVILAGVFVAGDVLAYHCLGY